MLDVRPIREDELRSALPLIGGYQRFYGAEPDDERNGRFFRRFLEPSDDGLLLGGWDGDELVGFACLYWTFSSVNAADIVLLNDLFVAESARGRGVGRALIAATVERARQRGARHVEWLTATDNVTAQRLYDAVGAERSEWYGYELRADTSSANR